MHYLDHAASSPLRDEAASAMAAALAESGNPSSLHRIGQQAQARLEAARAAIAASLGADPVEVILTSGGTEAINLALVGLFHAAAPERPVIVVPEGEHHAVLDTVQWLERAHGAELAWVPLLRSGRIDPDAWHAAFVQHRGRIALATILWVNNETGTIQDVMALAEATAQAGVPLHLDAVAAYGHEAIRMGQLWAANPDTLLSVSAHKIGGPQGVGALIVPRRLAIEPMLHGGGQQRKLRAGTENVLGAIGFAAAADAMAAHFDGERTYRLELRNRIREAVLGIAGARINGNLESASDAIVHATFDGCESDSLLFLLDAAGLAVSTGSACQAGVTEISHVVLALGYSEDEARGSLRFSLGHSSTTADVDALVAALPEAVDRARSAGRSARATRFDER